MQTTENDPTGIRALEVRPWIDLAPYLLGFELVSLSLGPNGELYVLAVTAPADYRYTAPSGASFPKVWTDHPHDVRILCVDGSHVAQRDIVDQHWNFSFAQPLPDDELLLVVSRSRCFADGTYDLNAKVYTRDGVLKREFLLGDGIRDVQTTTDGRLWIGYFDEGIFGNFGWKKPVGAHGFVLWDRAGARLYEFHPPDGYDSPADAYALNAISDTETWCYYYTDFPLVRIRNEQIDAVWQSPVHGSHGFAIWQDYVLFRGGYRNRHTFLLFQIDDDGVHHRLSFRIADEHGNILQIDRITARGSQIFALVGRCIYRLNVPEIASLR